MVSGGKGHGGDVTGTDTMMVGSVTSADSKGDDTKGTCDDEEMETGDKDEDAGLKLDFLFDNLNTTPTTG